MSGHKPTKLHLHAVEHFKRGAIAAADLADSYNSVTLHKYRLGDCILGKLNIRKAARPRRRVLNPNRARPDAIDLVFYGGLALGLAEIHRRTGDNDAVYCVARDAGLTLALARNADVDSFDLKQLKKAGIK